MGKSLCSAVALAAGLVGAAPLAAQDGLPVPAADAVEVRLTVEGVAEVPAQAYRVDALLNRRPERTAGGTPSQDRATVVRDLEARDLPEREICSPVYPTGLVGNEFLFGAEDGVTEDGADEEGSAQPVTTVADALAMIPQSYSGLFGTLEAAEDARRLLRPHASFALQVRPVLFDCAAASENATVAALANSRSEVEPIARALGMRIAGVTRVESGNGDQSVIVIDDFRRAQSGAVSDKVAVRTWLAVTYRLEK